MRQPNNIKDELQAAYREMADDTQRESEALEWAEATVSDVVDEFPLTPSEIDEQELP